MSSTAAMPAEARASRPRRGKSAKGQAAASPDVYTMAEAARLKGVSYHTVSRAVRRGKLPAQRLGRMALIAANDLREWRPMRERAPRKYRRREPDPGAAPALLDLASGERVMLAQRLATLFEVLHGAAGRLPLPEFLSLLADRLAAALDFRRIAIWDIDEETGTARRIAAFGPPLSALPPEPISLDQLPLFKRVLEVGAQPVVVNFPALGQAIPATVYNVTDLFVAPLRTGERVLGVLFGDCNGEPFSLSPEQQAMVDVLASQAALALDRARLLDEQARREAEIAAIVANVGEGVVAVDAAGRLTVVNAVGARLFGLGDPASADDARLDRDRAAMLAEGAPLRRALSGESVSEQRRALTRGDGSTATVSITAQPIRSRDGVVAGAVAIVKEAAA